MEILRHKSLSYYDENNYSDAYYYKFQKNTIYKPYPISNLEPNLKVSVNDIKIYYNIDITMVMTVCKSYNGKFNKHSSSKTTYYSFDQNIVKDPCTQRSLALFDPKTISLLVFDNPETAKLYKAKYIYSQEILDNGVILDNKEVPLTPDAFGNTTIKEVLSCAEVLRNKIKKAQSEYQQEFLKAQSEHQQKLLQQSIVSKNYDKIFSSST